MKPSSSQVVVERFNALEEELRHTFLNLIPVWSLDSNIIFHWYCDLLSLEELCRVLAIVQDQNPLEIRNHVYKLQDLKLVTLFDMDLGEYCMGDDWVKKKWLDYSNYKDYQKLERKVLSKNPHLNTFRRLSDDPLPTTNPFLLQQIRVLNLYGCGELENVDWENLPDLRCLIITDCAKLKVVNGWQGVKGLGWIEISGCPSYCYLPDVQFLSSLKEFGYMCCEENTIPWGLANFSQCVQLRRLFLHDYELVESMDLKALKFLEVLSFEGCSALSAIHGLSGLQTLIKLHVWGCDSLEMVPDLGCLKALTYLDMSSSGIVEIRGVEELHLLTSLQLQYCKSLKSLPSLGHLKALAYLDLSYSGIEEIFGVEDLVRLKTLKCEGSKLKRLPNLDHLCRSRTIWVDYTPLSRMDPSRSFIEGYELIQNNRMKESTYVDDVSDMSDS